jgi:uncharacterized membrane protein
MVNTVRPAVHQTFDDWQLVLQTPWGRWGIALAAVVALVCVLLSAWGQRQHGSLRLRVGLIALRTLAVTAVLLLVLQPAVQLRNVTRIPNHVAILLDTSRSMGIRASQRASRLERARALLKASKGRLAAWAKTRRVDVYAFGEKLTSLGAVAPPSLEATGDATRLRAALEQLRRRHRGDDLAGVVILSDGADNGRFGHQARGVERFAKRFAAPMHTVLVGAPGLRDVAITRVLADDFAFVRNALKVEADVLVQGIAEGTDLTVALKVHPGREVARRRLRVQAGKTSYRVSFEFVPQKVGAYVYEVTTPLLSGEALADNNRRRFLLRVIRDRIRVLQVCGRPSWDQRYLRRLLKRDPNVDLISFFILRTPASQALVPPSELSLIPFPTEELFERELGSFDLVILQNFNYGPYHIGIYLPHLRRYVLRGGGLAMLGGDLSFSSGGYANTPVGQVLPVSLLPSGLPPSQLIDEADFRPLVTAQGRRHPILQLGRDSGETLRLLGTLPAFAGVNRVRGLAAGATALLEHPTLTSEAGGRMPVLATREVGKGRTLALTSDSLWHWAFAGLGAPGSSRRPYDRFWQATMRWLIRDPELKYLRVTPQRERLRLGQSAQITIRATKPDYSPAVGVLVQWEVAGLAGKAKGIARRGRTDARGELRVRYQPPRVGAYRVRARAQLAGRDTREEALLLVRRGGLETRDPRARRGLLRTLAAASGGRFLGPAERLPELRFNKPRVLRVNWQRDVAIWTSGWALALVLLLLGVEWLLRRKAGHL